MRGQLPFSLFTLLLGTSVSIAEHLKPQNILWGERGPAGATLLPSTKTSLIPDPIEERDTVCTNTPTRRDCWAGGYSVATDFDKKWPTTGKTVHYDIEITNTTCNPDGHGDVPCLLMNNSYPGPTLIANWGDTLSVTVKNSMKDNGTGIHWHGMRQLGTVGMDGVPGITECPLAPGKSKTYTFKLTQYGTTWYHSHYSAQYGMGIVGGLIINGPTTDQYDIDLGTYMVNDWYYKTAYQVDRIANSNLQGPPGAGRAPPPGDNILVNGTNKTPDGTAGKYGTVKLTKGKKYLLRLINPSVDNQIRVSLDGHKMKIVTSDLVPIEPIETDWVLLGIGQRYNVIIEANQDVGNYWFRAFGETNCGSPNLNTRGTSAIFSYDGAPAGEPTSTGVPKPNDCHEPSPLVPKVPNTVPKDTFVNQAKILPINTRNGESNLTTNNQNIVYWGINSTAIDVDWKKPVLSYVREGNTSYPVTENLIELRTPGDSSWTYWIIQQEPTSPPVPHPIHLHGHDFYVLGQQELATFGNSSIAALKFDNPPRRDVAFLPNQGWLVIAFPTDNPGAWLMHCHIAWHVSQGLGAQFLENKDRMPAYPADYSQTCADWKDYYDNDPAYLKNDSGL